MALVWLVFSVECESSLPARFQRTGTRSLPLPTSHSLIDSISQKCKRLLLDFGRGGRSVKEKFKDSKFQMKIYICAHLPMFLIPSNTMLLKMKRYSRIIILKLQQGPEDETFGKQLHMFLFCS